MIDTTSLTKKVFTHPYYFVAFGFGSGLMPLVPGTWGTVVGVLLYVLLAALPLWLYLLLLVVFFSLGVFLCEKVSQDLKVHDFGGIVWDEVVGYLLTMIAVPFNWLWILVGFILFRVFDVLKPQPIRYVDKHVRGGLGIMLDDVLAAIPAALILYIIYWLKG